MLLNSIVNNEGFSGMPYNDSLGIPTIGYGTKLPITEEEAKLILKYRLDKKIEELTSYKPEVKSMPFDVQNVLYEMSYQLGVGGLLKFKKMWEALNAESYVKAADEMLDSKWARQTPNRAGKLAEIVRNYK